MMEFDRESAMFRNKTQDRDLACHQTDHDEIRNLKEKVAHPMREDLSRTLHQRLTAMEERARGAEARILDLEKHAGLRWDAERKRWRDRVVDLEAKIARQDHVMANVLKREADSKGAY